MTSLRMSTLEGGFGVYAHWPFCASKCPYCDFNTHVVQKTNHDAWRKAYLKEIARARCDTGARTLHSLFIGGGTPSLMEPETVAAIIEATISAWAPVPALEITIEANPGSADAGRFRDYAAAGVNRISIGGQALNDAALKDLGRIHSTKDIRDAVTLARDHFDHVSMDLIYARPGQQLHQWTDELREALTWPLDHLSLYQLVIEPGTIFAARRDRGGLRDLPGDSLAAQMYCLTAEMAANAGLRHYETSNYARGDALCRHNLLYWTGGDFVGIGPGAHGRLTMQRGQRIATECYRNPELWLNRVMAGSGESSRVKLSRDEQRDEYLLMALRLDLGASRARFARLSGGRLNARAIRQLEDDGLLTCAGDRIATTIKGRLLLDTVVERLATAPLERGVALCRV